MSKNGTPMGFVIVCVPAIMAACSAGREAAGNEREDLTTWTLEQPAATTIGGLDGREEYSLTNVRGAAFGRDGQVIVADGGSNEIRTYDSEGQFVRRAGGRGDGPGEFRAIRWIGTSPSGNLHVFDTQRRNLTTYTPDGGLGATLTIASSGDSPFPPMMVGMFPSGALVFRQAPNPFALRDEAEGERRATLTYLLYSQEGTEDHVLAAVRGEESLLSRSGSSFGTQKLIFGRSGFGTVVGDQFIHGTNDDYRLVGMTEAGDTAAVYSDHYDAQPVSDDEVAAARQELLADVRAQLSAGGPPQLHGILEARVVRIEAVHARPTRPAFSEIFGDASEHIWVADYRMPGETEGRWQVFDLSGGIVAQIMIPMSIKILAISGDRMIGLTKDELDVETVGVYLLAK